MQKDFERIESAGIRLVAISYDSADVLKNFAKQSTITFPLLSDPESKTIDRYGVRNPDVRKGSRQDGIPHPGTFVIDENGKVQAKLFYSIRKRHGTQELIDAAKGDGD